MANTSIQFVGHLSQWAIFKRTSVDSSFIESLFNKSSIPGSYYIDGTVYVNEVASSGVNVILLDSRFTKVTSTTSGVDGYYIFNQIPSGYYYVISNYANGGNDLKGPIQSQLIT